MITMKGIIFCFVAALLMFKATDIKRNKECEIIPFEKAWWLRFALITAAIAIAASAYT